MKKILIFILFLFLGITPPAHAAPPVDFQSSQIIGSGLVNPTGFDIAPDGRIFVLQQKGIVYIYKNGQLLAQPFATLPVSQQGGDLGLLGIAFDPNFNTNHYVYFYYTSNTNVNTVARLDATGDVAAGGPFIVYQSSIIAQQFHAGGTIEFGPDGKLYVSIGDNQYPPDAQSLNNPAGKVLRINADGSIPQDNPFVGQPGKIPEIWAYGLRNPFRFQFDSVSGRLYLGDVGQDTWEEINLITKGSNYGWPTCEGACNIAGMINPVYTYNHNGLSSSVTGGLVYNGITFPAPYQGSYFFGDFAQGFMSTLTLDALGASTGVHSFDPTIGSIVDMKNAPDGSIYYLTIFPGRLYQVTYATSNHVPVAKSSADLTQGPEPLIVHFSSQGSIDPDGTALTYNWDFGDGTTSTNTNPIKTYNNPGTYLVALTVSDGVYQAQAAPITIKAGTPPLVNITSPNAGLTYKAGDTISYDATATDSDGHTLAPSAFTTSVLFHHLTHAHPFLGPLAGQNAGQFDIPTSGESSPETFFEIIITATDAHGLSTTNSVSIFPIKVNLTFITNPANLNVLIDSQTLGTPGTIQSIVGFQREISTPTIQLLDGTYYEFDAWSDGGSQRHFITTPNANTTLTANFRVTSPFTATYFNNMTLSGSPVLTRNEGTIDHDFGGGSPDPSVNTDNFSARYVKQHFFHTGPYTFNTLSDDGVRLYIDGIVIIDKWVDQPSTPYSATVNLTEGDHEIKLEYYEHGGGAQIRLTWDVGSGGLPGPTPTPLPNGQAVTSYTLMNADTDQIIAAFDPIPNGATIDLLTLPTTHLNVRANTNPSPVGSVRFAYDGNTSFGTESYVPYALASDDNGDYFSWTPTVGPHSIIATPYTSQNGGGTAGTPLTLTFTVIQGGATPTPTPTSAPTATPTPVSGQAVTSYTLMNADTDQIIAAFDPIPANATIDLNSLSTRNLNIRANSNPATVGSIKFGFDSNANFRTENYTPYALASDENGDYFPFTPAIGSHTITATPYTGQGGNGTIGTALSLTFIITDSSGGPTPTATPTPTSAPTATTTPTPTPVSGQAVTSYTLMNADTDQAIAPFSSLNDGAIISLSALPTTHLNVRANTSPSTIGSLKFGFDSSASFQIENIAPYALAGDNGGDYLPWTPSIGAHTLTATPYTGEGLTGVVGAPLTIIFTVTD